MVRAGHPQNQAVAAALHNADRTAHRAAGGMMPSVGMGGIRPISAPHPASIMPRRDDGGSVGMMQSGMGGQASPAQGYIQQFSAMSPEQLQDLIGRLGTSPLAQIASNVLRQKRLASQPPQNPQQAMQSQGMQGFQAQPQPAGMQAPQQIPQAARGGEPHRAVNDNKQDIVPILAAGGEFVVNPYYAARWGDGEHDKGHRELDKFVVNTRREIVKEMRALRPPVGSKQ